MSNSPHFVSEAFTKALLSTIETLAESLSRTEEAFTLAPVNPIRILLAYSGGRDSEAMLHALSCLMKRSSHPAIESVTVMHVNHGISDNAEAWAEHCRRSAERYGLPFILEEVYVPKTSPDGLEAAARQVRYRALFRAAKRIGADVIFTAHHRDDQLETFLIQWMRGSGLEGLAGLAPERILSFGKKGEGVLLARPWLEFTREQIDRYVSKMHLTYVEDESNADSRYLRNLIRHKVFPALQENREGWKAAAARSIGLLSESLQLIREFALADTNACRLEANALSIAKLRSLSAARQALVLRQWLNEAGVRHPSQVKLTDTLRQIRESETDTRLAVRFEKLELRRWGERLILRSVVKVVKNTERDLALAWNGEAELSLGAWGGVLRFERVAEGEEGFDAAQLRAGPLFVRSRKGGEKIKLHPFRPSRHLKQLYQAADIPVFERDALPLIWLGEELIYAAGLGAEVRLFADKDLVPDRVRLLWVPDKTLF